MMNLTDDLLRHAQAFEIGYENGVTAESTARILREAAQAIKELDENNSEEAMRLRGEVISLKILFWLLMA
ncbi:MAG: hypothetical protein LUE87_06465, partial [Lachnospiraceae bacterium]|nr:hypothetical protein [Lachnospiraceae bacterium]